MIIPFLSLSSGGSQDRETEVLVLITFKFSGGPLGATAKERIVYKRAKLRIWYIHVTAIVNVNALYNYIGMCI